MNQSLQLEPIGDIVARDLRTASVFARHGIDFCCGGRRSVSDACREHQIDPDQLVREITDLTARPDGSADAASLPVPALIDRIVETHHRYVREQLPVLTGYLQKLVSKHGATRPELLEVREIVARLGADLLQHLMKEEQVLFPYIRLLATPVMPRPRAPFGSVMHPIRMMEHEHQAAAVDLARLRQVTDDYTPPAIACATWRACWAGLAAFEDDLHRHVHLENHVLFPAATRLEDEGAARS